ncbi:MAG: metalloregulator ArsR/SmtB family transcription factor [Candidatus Omnitrophota bacterium]|jgi:ArsR family transcriptional regulator
MDLKQVRQMLKSLSDDTRLRIVNLLRKNELSVNELCQTLGKKQSSISKHLSRLRLTHVVTDRRKGNNVYYSIAKTGDRTREALLENILKSISRLPGLVNDNEKYNSLLKKGEKK